MPWWDPGSDTSVSPESDHILIAGVRVARGSRVLMRPGARRADAQDLFLAGRSALVEAVLHDVDGNVHLAVTPEDDPAADLQRVTAASCTSHPMRSSRWRCRHDRRPSGGQTAVPAHSGPPTHPNRAQEEEMIGRLIKAALIAVVLAAIVQSLPDIKRYLELREM